ncbi:alpha/beta hydrolase [Nonomuraea sp. NPDC050790]|uniref:alpha/beta hydrolase n=1 Tax=Nonomuraea sp. NPDC050790 TaxID=3364371 RepID=UPI00379A6A38
MPLHPDAQAIIDRTPAVEPGRPVVLDPQTMREQFRTTWRLPDVLPEVAGVRDTSIPGPAGEIPVRVYTPEGAGPFPAFVWFHGGGWTIGSLDENEYACRTVCSGAGVVVVSVDYRLAPENPYPAAAEDCFAAVRWVHEHGAEIAADPGRIAVGGESAGGNLAAVAALKARDLGGPRLSLQVLISPVLGHPDDGRASYRDYAEGYFLSRASMEWFFTLYPRDPTNLRDPYLLPLRADDLSGLAPALVLGAEYDVLRDEGEEYAARLREAGVAAEAVRYDGLIHGFFGLLATELPAARAAHERVAGALRTAFGGGGR